MGMSKELNPHTELVEAQKEAARLICEAPTKDVDCAASRILSHINAALEYTPPPTPKLTPLPKYPTHAKEALNWLCDNRPALEAIITQQENTVEPHNVKDEVSRSEVEELRRRMDMAEKRIDVLGDDLKQSSEGFGDMVMKVHNRVCALEARDKQDAKPKPACDKCGDTKIIQKTRPLHFNHNVTAPMLCPCLKVGDVVSAEAANMLPVGSRFDLDGNVWERFDIGWDAKGSSKPVKKWYLIDGYKILRIGPAPEATTDHIADASKKVEPDRAEEIASEFLWGDSWLNADGGHDETKALADLLRKHGVGQPLPLADLIADPRLRPYWGVVRACEVYRNRGQQPLAISSLDRAVDALSPELRAAVEGVK